MMSSQKRQSLHSVCSFCSHLCFDEGSEGGASGSTSNTQSSKANTCKKKNNNNNDFVLIIEWVYFSCVNIRALQNLVVILKDCVTEQNVHLPEKPILNAPVFCENLSLYTTGYLFNRGLCLGLAKFV